MTIIHYDETSEFEKDILDLVALLGWMMDEEQNMNNGAINTGLRIAQGKIQRIRDRIRKEKVSHISRVVSMNEPIATLGDTCDQVHRFT